MTSVPTKYVPVLKDVIEHLYTAGMPKTWTEQRQAAADIYQNHGYASPFPIDLVTARKRLMASIRMHQMPVWVREDENLQPKYMHVMGQAKNCYRGIVVVKNEVQNEDDDHLYGDGWLNHRTEESSADEDSLESEEFDFDNPRVLTKKRAILKPKRFVEEDDDTPLRAPERCVIRRLETVSIKQEPVGDEEMPEAEKTREQTPQSQQEMPTPRAVTPTEEVDELEATKAELEELRTRFEEQEEALIDAREKIGELRQQLEVSEDIIDNFKVECHEREIENEWLKAYKGFDPIRNENDENSIHTYLLELEATHDQNLAALESQKIHYEFLVEQAKAREAALHAQNQLISGQLLMISTLQNELVTAKIGSETKNVLLETQLSRNINVELRKPPPLSPSVEFSHLLDNPQPKEEPSIQNTRPPPRQTKPIVWQSHADSQTADQHVPVGESHSTTSIDSSQSV